MSITTYSELQTALDNWTSRADLASRIPEGIALAEAKINRRIRTLDMVTKNASFSITDEYVAVPTNFGGAKTFHLNTSPRQNLEPMSDEEITTRYPTSTGQPKAFDVQGSNFRFGPRPDATYTATLVYWLKVPALSNSSTTNWLLTSHPDCYLYLSLAEMEGFKKNFDAAAKWEGMGYQILDELQKQSNRDRVGGSSIATRPDSPVY